MINKKHIRFIINPISGIGRQKTVEKLIPNLLDSEKFNYDIVYTQHAGHAKDLANQAVEEEIHIVAVVGGDGSIHEASESLLYSNCILAIIPTGSGNGIARHFNIPLNTKKAIALLNHFSISDCDTGTIDNHYFLGFAGMGFDAHIAHEFAKMNKRGFWGYTKIVLRDIRKYKMHHYQISNERGESQSENLFMLTVANVREFGNGVIIDPEANAGDGEFSACMIKKIPLSLFPITMAKTFRGKINRSNHYQKMTGKEFSITSQNQLAHVDGEPIYLTNNTIIIKNHTKSIKIAIPIPINNAT